MKKFITVLLSASLIIGISYVPTSIEAAETAAKKYGNCKELNKDYEGGVARTSSAKNKGGKTKYKPFVSKALYDANAKKDRDKDNIACER